MRQIFIAILALFLISTPALAKPLKIETLGGTLVRCGEWKNTTRAVVIRGCPELSVLFEASPIPEPTPTLPPTPTPSPEPSQTPTPTPLRECTSGVFNRTRDGVGVLQGWFNRNVQYKLCADLPRIDKYYIEFKSVNHSNSQCNFYETILVSPSGIMYDASGIQPGKAIKPEEGRWIVNLKLTDDERNCAEVKRLSMTFMF